MVIERRSTISEEAIHPKLIKVLLQSWYYRLCPRVSALMLFL